MNKLEKALLDGARTAAACYKKMTTWDLWDAPESFLQIVTASELNSKTGNYAAVETSEKTLRSTFGIKGRLPKFAKRRFDIVIAAKNGQKILAVVEIKRRDDSNGVTKDAEKIRSYLAGKHSSRRGYLLAFSWARSREKFEKKMRRWAEKTKSKYIDCRSKRIDKDWFGGEALFRVTE